MKITHWSTNKEVVIHENSRNVVGVSGTKVYERD